MNRPSLFVLIERRAPLVVLAARLRGMRLVEQFDDRRWQAVERVRRGEPVASVAHLMFGLPRELIGEPHE